MTHAGDHTPRLIGTCVLVDDDGQGLSFALALRALRETRHRLSQSRLAELAGLDHSFVGRMEAGQRRPSRMVVERLADALAASDAERDTLLAAAGYRAARDDDPTVVALAVALGDPSIPLASRERLRLAVELLLEQVMEVRA